MLLSLRLSAVLVVLCGLLTGCASGTRVVSQPNGLLKDDLFPNAAGIVIETEQQVFQLDNRARAYVDNTRLPLGSEVDNIRALVKTILDPETGVRYLTSANTVASDTFAHREANCLSLTIMTYAMADYAGFDPILYEVAIPEYWTRREGISLLNGHINMRVTVPTGARKTTLSQNYMDVDFDPQTIRSHFPRVEISRKKVLAMFYNNKGADSLIAGESDQAYAYFKSAAEVYPSFGATWVNLGVLYRQHSAYEAAEASYKHALALDDENYTAWENLAMLHTIQGQNAKASQIGRKLTSERENNPFYHFILGEEAFDNGEPEQALKHYYRARKLNSERHEILYGLGKAYFELGDIDKAVTYIKLAARHAPGRYEESRYLSKLPSLQSAR